MVDGKTLRLADEVRYIQRRAADHDGRIVTMASLSCFPPIPAMRGCWTPPISSPHGWPAMETPNQSASKKTIPPLQLIGRAAIASMDPHSFTSIEKPETSPPSTDTRRTS